jgi:hypothetical protein
MLRSLALVRVDVSEESNTIIIWMARIDELGTTLAVTSNRHALRRNTVLSIVVYNVRYALASDVRTGWKRNLRIVSYLTIPKTNTYN